MTRRTSEGRLRARFDGGRGKRLRIRPWAPVVLVAAVSMLPPIPSPCTRAQAVKAEPAPSPAAVFPAKVVEAMRREAEARSKEQETLFARARADRPAAPPVVPNAPVAQVPVVIERVVAVPAAPAPLPRREPVMIKKQAVAVPAGAVNPGLNQQWLTRMRPILRVEYQFLRSVCDPTKERRMPIARAGLVALDDAVKKFLEWHNVRNRGGMVVNGKIENRGGVAELPDP